MNKRIQTALYQATVSTFESMGFLLPTRELDEKQLNAPAEAIVYVDFHGPVSGRLYLRTFGDLLPTLTANMMGSMEAPSAPLQQDALGELANVICGHIVSQLADPTAAYKLDSPAFLSILSAGHQESKSPEVQIQLGVENGRAVVELLINEGTVSP